MTRATSGNLLFGPGEFPQPRRRSKSSAPAARTWRALAPGAVLLGLDCSIAKCGWSILRFSGIPEFVDSGVFHPKASDDREAFEHLALLIVNRIRESREAGVVITDALIEVPHGGGLGGGLMMNYGQAVGVCRATCYRAGLRLHTVGASKWRSNTRDCKHLTALAVRATFKECRATTENNELDAIGLGMFLCNQSRVRRG